jgi:hypothetical protein
MHLTSFGSLASARTQRYSSRAPGPRCGGRPAAGAERVSGCAAPSPRQWGHGLAAAGGRRGVALAGSAGRRRVQWLPQAASGLGDGSLILHGRLRATGRTLPVGPEAQAGDSPAAGRKRAPTVENGPLGQWHWHWQTTLVHPPGTEARRRPGRGVRAAPGGPVKGSVNWEMNVSTFETAMPVRQLCNSIYLFL